MRDAEGRGVAMETAMAARAYAYGVLGWQTAVGMIDPGNARSLRLAQRLGCRMEGMFQHSHLGPMEIWRHPAPSELE